MSIKIFQFMLKAQFRYSTVLKNKRKLLKYGFYLITEINGLRCEMQLDTGCPFTYLTNKFLKKNRLFKEKVNSYKNYDKNSINGYYSHIKKVYINIEGIGKFLIPKCYIEIIKTSKEQEKKIKEINNSELPFAGYLGCDIFYNKIFEINFKERLIIFYSSLNELLYTNYKTDFHSFSIVNNMFIFPYTLNNFNGQAIFDTGSSRYTFILKNSLFKDLIKNSLIHLSYEDIIRPDFIARIYKYRKKVSLNIGNLKIRKELFIYTPNNFFSNYLFSHNTNINTIFGNALFFDKRIIFDTINKKFAILES